MNRSPSNGASVRPPHRSTVSAVSPPSEGFCSDLAREMRSRWHAGERPPAEEFFARDPHLAEQPEAAVELIYEEFCLRDAAGDADAEADILRRFPQFQAPLRVMLDCHRRVIQPQRERPRFPAAGERVGEFRLTAELARGSRGRVFLATQAALADRPVVLKLTPLDGAEHLSLARLQHTNIVPLYSVTDDVVRNLRVLCMPYFGRATLASLLESLSGVALSMRSGRDVVSAIDRSQDDAAPTVAGAARQMLANVSYVQAMCWIAACVADALQFAHERGVLHLDLKPSNVLLATDGQPMLLDFHLAREPIHPGSALPDNIGGTPPYMPPEQQAAMRAIQEGKPVEQTVDARADIYALGAMLYEALGGRLPITVDAPPLSSLNPQVSQGLSDIIARCVTADANERYPDAQTLADDLRRHLTDQPLAGVANRSVRERWTKWRRRRPAAFRTAAAVAIAAGAMGLLAASALFYSRDHRQRAAVALSEGQMLMRDSSRNAGEAVHAFERGLGLVEGLPFAQGLRGQLQEQLAIAKRQQLAQQLHRLADEVRLLYGVETIAPSRRTSLAAQCVALWQRRRAVVVALDQSAQLSADLQDLAIYAAHVSPDDAAARLLNEAEAEFGPSAVLDHERRRRKLSAPTTPPSAAPRPPTTAWEHYALGRSLLAADDLDRAAEHLAAAVRLDPAGRWPNFYYGVCAYRTSRNLEAIAAFSVCIGTSPDVAGVYYNRALAYAALGQSDEALEDYDRTLQLDPAHTSALLNRGLTHFERRNANRAVADLTLALKHGADAGTVHYNLAVIYAASNDRPRALQHADHAAQATPAHGHAGRLRDTLHAELSAAKSGH